MNRLYRREIPTGSFKLGPGCFDGQIKVFLYAFPTRNRTAPVIPCVSVGVFWMSQKLTKEQLYMLLFICADLKIASANTQTNPRFSCFCVAILRSAQKVARQQRRGADPPPDLQFKAAVSVVTKIFKRVVFSEERSFEYLRHRYGIQITGNNAVDPYATADFSTLEGSELQVDALVKRTLRYSASRSGRPNYNWQKGASADLKTSRAASRGLPNFQSGEIQYVYFGGRRG